MKAWATDKGQAVQQWSVRQETTKYKSWTLPLYIYQTQDIPETHVEFEQLEERCEQDNVQIHDDIHVESNDKEGQERDFDQTPEHDVEMKLKLESWKHCYNLWKILLLVVEDLSRCLPG